MVAIGWVFFVWLALVVVATSYWTYYLWKHNKFSEYTDLVWNDKYDPLLSSPFISSKNLTICRTIIALFCFIFTLEWIIVWGFVFFVTFTVWNWTMVTLYFCIISIMGWYNIRIQNQLQNEPDYGPDSIQKRTSAVNLAQNQGGLDNDDNDNDTDIEQDNNNNNKPKLENKPSRSIDNSGFHVINKLMKYRYFLGILLIIQCVNTLMVDVILWGVLFPYASRSDWPIFFNWHAMVMHTVNLVFIYFDLIICNVKIDSMHLAYPAMLVGIIYTIFTWILVQFNGGVFVYTILDTREPFNVIWYFVVFALVFGFFWIAKKTVQCREKSIEKDQTIQKQTDTQIENGQQTV